MRRRDFLHLSGVPLIASALAASRARVQTTATGPVVETAAGRIRGRAREGVVTFKIGVDEKGDVADVRIVERAGHGFDEAAAKAMRRFKFKPAIANDGRPVPCRISYTFRFNLTQ